ncbi:hypothetical protein INR49_018294 [Caranx melampygus]|nr:hypothetical protein INR49_018294 [Caranx melampygus]
MMRGKDAEFIERQHLKCTTTTERPTNLLRGGNNRITTEPLFLQKDLSAQHLSHRARSFLNESKLQPP